VPFDALLLLTFGGPESPAEVMPFLENVLRGRPVPRERLEQVAAQYMEMGGRSPINDQSRRLLARLAEQTKIPLYWGTRNWHPALNDTVARMADDGVRRAAVFVPSAYASYSGCRQYLENLEAATTAAGPAAPELVKIPPFYDHPGFVGPMADGLRRARADAGPDAPVLMSAHSIPSGAAATCDYVSQLQATMAAVAAGAGEDAGACRLVFQSRSGPPDQPWLGPDVGEALQALTGGTSAAIVVPLGFASDHMEVVYDLDRKAAATAAAAGIRLVRSATAGEDPRFVDMILDLVHGLEGDTVRPSCRPGCCPSARP